MKESESKQIIAGILKNYGYSVKPGKTVSDSFLAASSCESMLIDGVPGKCFNTLLNIVINCNGNLSLFDKNNVKTVLEIWDAAQNEENYNKTEKYKRDLEGIMAKNERVYGADAVADIRRNIEETTEGLDLIKEQNKDAAEVKLKLIELEDKLACVTDRNSVASLECAQAINEELSVIRRRIINNLEGIYGDSLTNLVNIANRWLSLRNGGKQAKRKIGDLAIKDQFADFIWCEKNGALRKSVMRNFAVKLSKRDEEIAKDRKELEESKKRQRKALIEHKNGILTAVDTNRIMKEEESKQQASATRLKLNEGNAIFRLMSYFNTSLQEIDEEIERMNAGSTFKRSIYQDVDFEGIVSLGNIDVNGHLDGDGIFLVQNAINKVSENLLTAKVTYAEIFNKFVAEKTKGEQTNDTILSKLVNINPIKTEVDNKSEEDAEKELAKYAERFNLDDEEKAEETQELDTDTQELYVNKNNEIK